MATFTAVHITEGQPAITGGQAGVVVCNDGACAVPDTLAADDIVQLAYLPAGHKPIDVIFETTDLDTHGTPAIEVSIGVVNADADDLVATTNFITTSTVAQTGGVARADVLNGLQLGATTADRIIGVKVTTVAATEAAGTMRLKVMSVPV